MLVIKCGGASLPKLSQSFVEFVDILYRRESVVLVHGGGPAINELEQKLCLSPQFSHCGRRITNTETLDVVIQIICGKINSWLVSLLVTSGVPAFGLSGFDGGLLRAKLKDYHSLGWVGEIVEVRTEILENLCQQGFLPVVAPVSLQMAGVNSEKNSFISPRNLLNVNADDAAIAIAIALGAKNMVFISNIPGILNREKKLQTDVSELQIKEMIGSGEIYGGMIPKVKGALAVLKDKRNSLEKVYIIDGTASSLLHGYSSDLFECLRGTCIHL